MNSSSNYSHWQPSQSSRVFDPYQERHSSPDSLVLHGKQVDHRSNTIKPKTHHLDPLLSQTFSLHGSSQLSKCLSSSTEALPPIPILDQKEPIHSPLAKAAEVDSTLLTRGFQFATRKPIFFPNNVPSMECEASLQPTFLPPFSELSDNSKVTTPTNDTDKPPKRRGWWDNEMKMEEEKEHVKSLLRKCIIETDGHPLDNQSHEPVQISKDTEPIRPFEPLFELSMESPSFEPTPPPHSPSKDSTPRSSQSFSKRHSIHRLLAARNFNQSDELTSQPDTHTVSSIDISGQFASVPSSPSSSRPSTDPPRRRIMQKSSRASSTAPCTSQLNKPPQSVTLKYCLDHFLFQQAMELVSATQTTVLLQMPPDVTRNRISQGFEDLLYVLSKYWFLHEIQLNPDQATHILHHVIKPVIDRETSDLTVGKDQEHRIFWFKQDYRMLCDVQAAHASDTNKPNMYASLDLNVEIKAFWESAYEYHRLEQQEAKLPSFSLHSSPASKSLKKAFKRLPLYARIVHDYFIKKSDDNLETRERNESPKMAPEPILPSVTPASTWMQATPVALYTDTQPLEPSAIPSERRSTVYSSRSKKITPRTAGSKPGTAVSKSEFDERSIGPGYIPVAEVEKHMPPPCAEGETADFGLNAICGPALNHIKALDITVDPLTKNIVAATAGGETRIDKRISLWDVRSGSLLNQLDNTTHKAVLTLSFHPQEPHLLLSSDMEFDVKLWDWRKGELLQCWKKMHTRIIYKCLFIPYGQVWRVATCSADHSIKLWNSQEKQPHVASMHANEPFTSFVLCGSASNDISSQILVASLSYTLRVYKTRTLTLLHTIQMKDLKTNKTPITSICSHPLYDNYILLSCDNQIRLFDLSSEMTLRTFSARELSPGMRIEGMFSPCGMFVYCATWDCRSFSFHKSTSFPLLATGMYIWNVYTSKLERADMRALQDAVGNYKSIDSHDLSLPITCCKWIQKKDGDRTIKALVLVALDKTIRMYL